MIETRIGEFETWGRCSLNGEIQVLYIIDRVAGVDQLDLENACYELPIMKQFHSLPSWLTLTPRRMSMLGLRARSVLVRVIVCSSCFETHVQSCQRIADSRVAPNRQPS